jgi:hypothetical protein
MPEHEHGLLDSSVVIDHDNIDVGRLPAVSAVVAITLAKLPVRQ